MDENLYTLDATEIVIRISADEVTHFNKLNAISINQIKNELQGKEIECFFQKLSNKEHKIIVPVLNGQIEFVVIQHLSETYQAIVNKKLKTVFQKDANYPESCFKEIATIRIIDINEKGRASDEFVEIFKKVSDLKISSNIDIVKQQSIWEKYIDAQKAIIESLQKPYEVKEGIELQEIKNDKGEISRYTLTFDLATEFLPEYRRLEKTLQDLGIDAKCDVEGNIFLTRQEIQVLDAVIQREFPMKLERSPTISAIIGIKPLTLAKKIQLLLPEGISVSQNAQNKQLFVACRQNKHLNRILRQNDFEFISYIADFTIINHGNIIDNDIINKKYRITFGDKFLGGIYYRERLLPYPKGNTFSIWNREYFSLQLFFNMLVRMYGQENIETSITSVYQPINNKKVDFFEKDFSDVFWVDLKRNLYIHQLEECINRNTKTLYLEFNNETELSQQFQVIENLKTCDIKFSPLEENFKFKVKTNVIAKKTEMELFLEKVKLLRGADFVAEIPKGKDKRPDLVYLGKINGYESNVQKIVLNIPNIFPSDKKKAKAILEFLYDKKKPIIKSIRANLIGDATKIKWLQEAIGKITKTNGRAVNGRLGEFIFDTSKATPIYDINKVKENSEYYWSVRKNELLTLNESQRKAVLAAIHCSDLALLQGPPGTGKTTVIAEMIWQIISQNPKHKILLTSETNLAVDNALDRLLNTKGVNEQLVKYTTLIKPLRFGKMRKMDEEGAKYSADRILKWLDVAYQVTQEYESSLDEQDEDDDVEKNSPENNAVQDWMKRIAGRARNNDPKYAIALKDWALDLSFPSTEIKQIFKDKYFEYANIVGSTCSSSGSPTFKADFAKVSLQKEFSVYITAQKYWDSIKDLKYQLERGENEENAQILQFILKRFSVKKDELMDLLIKPSYSFIQELYIGELQEILKLIKKQKQNGHLKKLLDRHDFKLASDAETFLNQKFTVQFDTIIMDEASKATPPELVLPLCFGKRFIIIGDHMQLPPMLNEKDFKEALQDAGAAHLAEEIDREFTETSQFERMILNPNVPPTIISRCNIQYRMHPHINDVIRQFYTNTEAGDTGLFPAQELIENADDTNLNNIFSRHHGLYFPDFIDANTHTIWIDVKSPEIREGTSVTNDGEVEAIKTVIQLLQKAEGFEQFQNHWDCIKDEFKRKQEREIGVISFYGAQKRLLKRGLVGANIPLKINTVDRFQGMERNIIIVSTVRSNKQIKFGGRIDINNDVGFAKSPQRLNVALSRARRLLIVVGNLSFFEQVRDKTGKYIYKNAIQEMAKNGKIIDFETLQQLNK